MRGEIRKSKFKNCKIMRYETQQWSSWEIKQKKKKYHKIGHMTEFLLFNKSDSSCIIKGTEARF